MTRVEIRKPFIEDIATVVTYIRDCDREECAAMAGASPADAVRRSIDLSHEAWAGLADGVPVCLFGLGIGVPMAGIARPWLLATDRISDHRIAFLRRNKEMVERWAAAYPYLENWVDARNVQSVAWLRWLGFNIEEAKPFGPFRYDFHRFTMITPTMMGRGNKLCASS